MRGFPFILLALATAMAFVAAVCIAGTVVFYLIHR